MDAKEILEVLESLTYKIHSLESSYEDKDGEVPSHFTEHHELSTDIADVFMDLKDGLRRLASIQ